VFKNVFISLVIILLMYRNIEVLRIHFSDIVSVKHTVNIKAQQETDMG